MKNYHLFFLLFIFAPIIHLVEATNINKDIAISSIDEESATVEMIDELNAFDFELDDLYDLDYEDWDINIDDISIEDINDITKPSWWNQLKIQLKIVSAFLKLKAGYAQEEVSSSWNSLRENVFYLDKIVVHVRKHKKKYEIGIVCFGTSIMFLVLYLKRSR